MRPQVFEVDPRDLGSAGEGLEAAAIALERGLLVVMPTETVYGIACRPDDPGATDRVFRAKRRPQGLSLPVLAGSAEQAWEVAERTNAAGRLAGAFWPGPLTLVLPRRARAVPWDLGEARDSVAVRVPDHHVCLSLLRRTGPLAATSANLSGRPPLLDRASLVECLGDAVQVYLVVSAGAPSPTGRPSTVIDLTGPNPRVIRTGPVSWEAARRVLAG